MALTNKISLCMSIIQTRFALCIRKKDCVLTRASLLQQKREEQEKERQDRCLDTIEEMQRKHREDRDALKKSSKWVIGNHRQRYNNVGLYCFSLYADISKHVAPNFSCSNTLTQKLFCCGIILTIKVGCFVRSLLRKAWRCSRRDCDVTIVARITPWWR